MIRLVHFSTVDGLKAIDPNYMGSGTGFGGRELRQGIPDVRWMHFYREGSQYEPQVEKCGNKYIVEQDEVQLYDLADDEEGIINLVVLNHQGVYNRDIVLKAIKEAGFEGFYNSSVGLPGAIGLFIRKDVL